jgi:hypothetical protein
MYSGERWMHTPERGWVLKIGNFYAGREQHFDPSIYAAGCRFRGYRQMAYSLAQQPQHEVLPAMRFKNEERLCPVPTLLESELEKGQREELLHEARGNLLLRK